jgi:nitric oxide synthase oxygenase domain/subunit
MIEPVVYRCRDCNHAFADFYAYDAHRTGVVDHRPPAFGQRCLLDFEKIERGLRRVAGVWMLPAALPAAGSIWDSEYEGKP